MQDSELAIKTRGPQRPHPAPKPVRKDGRLSTPYGATFSRPAGEGKRAAKRRETAQDVIRDFFATLARVHGAPGPAAQEKP